MMNKKRQRLTTALMAAVACFLLISTAAADQVILDDLIVDGSACIGMDCVNGESFGFDTLRLKENNLRIKFDDTSSSASFPDNDWQITANDSTNGGAEKFSIDDISNGKTPFTIEANSASHTLYVDSGKRIGINTSTPVVELHVVDGDSPTLRLEQDGSSGFTPQTWDVVGNETNFFVRDVTNGSQLPFRIIPGADTDAMRIQADGDVQLLQANSSKELTIRRTAGAGSFNQVTFQGGATNEWAFGNDNSMFYIFNYGLSTNSLAINAATDAVTIAGTCTDSNDDGGVDGCDAVFEPTYDLPSIEEHAEFMWKNKHLPAIGPTPEGQRISFSVQERHFGVLNELEKAHIYIERLNERLKAKEVEFDELASRLARLEQADAR